MITDSKPAIEGLNRSYLQPKQKFTWIKTEIIKEKLKEKIIKLKHTRIGYIKPNGSSMIQNILRYNSSPYVLISDQLIDLYLIFIGVNFIIRI